MQMKVNLLRARVFNARVRIFIRLVSKRLKVLPAFTKAAQRSDNLKYIILFGGKRGLGEKHPERGFSLQVKQKYQCRKALIAYYYKNRLKADFWFLHSAKTNAPKALR